MGCSVSGGRRRSTASRSPDPKASSHTSLDKKYSPPPAEREEQRGAVG